MALTLTDLTAAEHKPDPTPRDRWGRYLIPDPATGKPRGWTRATTIAKTLEDPENLTRWKCRMVATGVAQRPAIGAGIVAAQGDKQETNRLVEQALKAAGANENRDKGTALHRIFELVDTGQMRLEDVPEPWGADVAAYRRQLAAKSLTVAPEWCEVIFLNAPLEIAGTADRLYQDHEGKLVVADIKTGGYISWLAFAMQFAIYATATHIYNPTTGVLADAPAMRDDHTLMVHSQAGTGRCVIEPLSVAAGYDAVLMALEVRRIRAKDKRPRDHIIASTWQPPVLEVAPTLTAVPDPDQAARHLRADLVQRIGWLRVNDPELLSKVARQWPDQTPTLSQSVDHTPADLERIAHVLNQLSVPF